MMEESIEEPIPIPQLARRLRISLRQLQRVFVRELGTSPHNHYRLLRLARAHALLQQTTLPVTQVAVSAGYSSPEHFARVYRKAFGRAPRTDRRQATDAPVLRRPIGRARS